MHSFAENLKKLRLKNGWLQDDLANSLGLSKQVISTYETGSRSPSLDNLVRIANLFEVSTDYLLGVDNLGLSAEAFKKISKLHAAKKQNPVDKRISLLSKIIENEDFETLMIYTTLYVFDGQMTMVSLSEDEVIAEHFSNKLIKAILLGNENNRFGLSDNELRMINEFRREVLLMWPRDEYEKILDNLRIQEDITQNRNKKPKK